MSNDFTRIFESKRLHRQALAGKPVGEKLLMLDTLRERAVVIRRSRQASIPGIVKESSAEYRTKKTH